MSIISSFLTLATIEDAQWAKVGTSADPLVQQWLRASIKLSPGHLFGALHCSRGAGLPAVASAASRAAAQWECVQFSPCLIWSRLPAIPQGRWATAQTQVRRPLMIIFPEERALSTRGPCLFRDPGPARGLDKGQSPSQEPSDLPISRRDKVATRPLSVSEEAVPLDQAPHEAIAGVTGADHRDIQSV